MEELLIESAFGIRRGTLTPNTHEQVDALQSDVGQGCGDEDDEPRVQIMLGGGSPVENIQSDAEEHDEGDDTHGAAQQANQEFGEAGSGSGRPPLHPRIGQEVEKPRKIKRQEQVYQRGDILPQRLPKETVLVEEVDPLQAERQVVLVRLDFLAEGF